MSDITKLQTDLEEMKKFNDDLSNFLSFDKFDSVFEKTKSLLDVLGDNASQHPIINIGGKGTHSLFADFFIATSQTLKSITACCKLGNFSDANMLNRKYRDDLFQYLYIIQVTKSKKVFDESELDQYRDSEMTPDKFVEMVLKAYNIELSGIRKDSRTKGIEAWFENTLEGSGKEFKRCYFQTSTYIKYLKENKSVKDCYENYLKAQWDGLDRRQNNFTHGNGRKFISANSISVRDKENAKILLDQIINDVSLTTACFLSLLILIEPIYISASDYVDYLDCGLTPPEGSQYWIASIVQDYINEFVEIIHPDLKTYLIENNPYGMEIT